MDLRGVSEGETAGGGNLTPGGNAWTVKKPENVCSALTVFLVWLELLYGWRNSLKAIRTFRRGAGEASPAGEDPILGSRDLLHNLGENLIRVDIFRFRLEVEDDAMAQSRINHLSDVLVADMDSAVGQRIAFSP